VGSSLAAPAADPQLVKVAAPYINQGAASGPLTPAIGDLVATPKGYKSLALEGFSEDLNQDGFVDPIGQAVVPVVHQAPIIAAAPFATGRNLSDWADVIAPKRVVAAAPAVHTYTVPAATTKVVAAPAVAAYTVPRAPAVANYLALSQAPAVATYAVPRAPAVVTYAEPRVPVVTAPVVQHVGYNVHQTVQHVPQVAVQKHVTQHVTQHVINHAPVVGAAFNNALYVPTVVSPVASAVAPEEAVPGAVEMA